MSYQLGKKVNDEGVWKEFSGARLKIARAGNVEFLKGQEDLEKPYRKKLDRGTLGAKIKRDINLRGIARGILIDWDGVVDEEGKSVTYTEDLGVEILLNDPDILEFILDISLDNDNYIIERVTKISKKSSRQSTG